MSILRLIYSPGFTPRESESYEGTIHSPSYIFGEIKPRPILFSYSESISVRHAFSVNRTVLAYIFSLVGS
jgi:hypothetical protein